MKTIRFQRVSDLLRGGAGLVMIVLFQSAFVPCLAVPERKSAALTEEQRQRLFTEQKALWLALTKSRIDILKSAESCIARSVTQDAFQSCMRQQADANHKQFRSHQEAMRELYSKLGLPFPKPNLDRPIQAPKPQPSS